MAPADGNQSPRSRARRGGVDMKKLRPGVRTPGRGDSGFHETAPFAAFPRQLQLTNRNLLLGHLRQVWWAQWRHGNRLPAERGKIVIDGGINPNWPRPRTQRPWPEDGGPGGAA